MGKKLLWVLTLIYFNSISMALSTNQRSLPALECEEKDVIGYNTGIRPYREGGIMLEKKSIEDKAIFHNYGHGGAGATLAPGCVDHVVSSFLKGDPEQKPIGVIGSGFMGLLTANRLADEGYKVTVFAQQLPTKDYFYKESQACITSQAGGGFWFPFGVDKGDDLSLFKSLQKNSFNFYKKRAESDNPAGVSFRKVYSFSSKKREEFPEELETPKPVEVEFGNGKYFQAEEWSTIHIDNTIFIQGLYKTAQGKNVQFKEQSFSTTEDVLALAETYIFSCTGYGSKHLFNDNAMKPIRGQLVYLKPQPKFNFFLFGQNEAGSPVAIYPSSDKIAIGFTYEEGVETLAVVPEKLKEIRENAASFFKDKVH